MHAFITGSRTYGEPRSDSDIDLVIRTDQPTADALLKLSGGKLPIRFGNLNLIVCTTDDDFAVWRLGTTFMARQKLRHGSYNKGEAKDVLDGLRDYAGIKDKAPSGKEEV